MNRQLDLINLTGKWLLTICCMLVIPASALLAQSNIKSDKAIRQGNKLYRDSDYEGANASYEEALEIVPNSDKGIFNQGNAYYKQDKFDEALQNFEITAEMFEDPVRKANALHNVGNTLFKQQDLEKSIEAYKNALRLNPNDEDTRYNLALAQSMLQQQEQQNQDQQDQEDQDQENQEEQENQNENQDENQQNQDQNEQEQQNEESQSENGEQQEEGEQQQGEQSEGEQNQGEEEQQSMMQQSELTKEEVQRILEALANDENKVQEKIIKKKTKTSNIKIEKDW